MKQVDNDLSFKKMWQPPLAKEAFLASFNLYFPTVMMSLVQLNSWACLEFVRASFARKDALSFQEVSRCEGNALKCVGSVAYLFHSLAIVRYIVPSLAKHSRTLLVVKVWREEQICLFTISFFWLTYVSDSDIIGRRALSNLRTSGLCQICQKSNAYSYSICH